MPEKGNLNTSEVKFWIGEANSCIERQRRELRHRNNYPFLVNYFEGVIKSDAIYPHVGTEETLAIINEYFPNTNMLISELMYQNPDILLDALKPQAEEDLPIMKSALEHFFSRSDGLTENRVALFDMLYAGYCGVEVDQLPPSDRPDANMEEAEEPEGLIKKVTKGIKNALNPDEAERNLAKSAPPMEANFSTVQGTYIRRYDPLDVPLDWRAERIKDRRYNLKLVWMSKAEFDVKYPKYKDTVGTEEHKFENSKHDLDIHNRKVMLYEFQVRLKGDKYQTIVLSPSVKTKELDSFIRPYTTNGFNMKIGTLHKYGRLYPRSIAQINKKMSDELNEYTNHMMEVAERNVPKYVYDESKVKLPAITALKSSRVNDMAPVSGNTTGAVTPLPATAVSFENKELMSIFQDQKNKLWSVSEARISGRAQNEFATDSVIQEEGFKSRNVDIQEGLRNLIVDELNTGKDCIVEFWDGEVFLKVTGSEKMDWYEPELVTDPNNPNKPMVANPLTELLTADYFVDIDIASSSRPNRDQQLQRMDLFMQRLAAMRQILIDQGWDINVDEVKRISKEFGWNPDKVLVKHKPQLAPTLPTAGGESISPEEDAARQAEAQQQVDGGNPAAAAQAV